MTSPIQYGLYKSSRGITKQFEFIILTRKVSQENKALTEQLAQVLSENANLRKKLNETQAFADQQVLSAQTFNLVATRPIGMTRYLILDKGSDDGFKVGLPVVYKDSYLGKINFVSAKRSEVMLSSDPDSHIAAYVADNNGKAKGVLNGQFGSEMVLDKILHEEPLTENDLVYSEGSELEIPRGLVLGQVSQVLGKDNGVFKQAKIKPMFDLANLDVVFVIKD